MNIITVTNVSTGPTVTTITTVTFVINGLSDQKTTRLLEWSRTALKKLNTFFPPQEKYYAGNVLGKFLPKSL